MGGFEGPVNQWLHKAWEPYSEQLATDPIGNLIAHVGGSGPKLLIAAHADEIGFVVRSIDENGFVWIVPKNLSLGRPSRDTFLLGQPALIQTDAGTVDGTFAAISGHVAPVALREKAVLDWDDVFVDVGLSSRESAAAAQICVGDPVIWNPPTRRVGDLVVGKAMDDRAALAVMTELLPRLNLDDLNYDLYFASTIQEEMGLVGASALERHQAFDLAVAFDVGLAGDVPGVSSRDMPVELGCGPILVHHDLSVHYDRELTKALSTAAQGAGIPVQDAVFARYSSDGAEFIRLGIPTALLAFPTRYTHSPFETIHEADLEQCAALLQAFLTSPSTS